ncbi:MAG: glycosyltransferase family 2 protein [Algoriphagus sp.]|uniref:glycosyltransferase family 2 protein n=1 Tax=Algoriphagus sp. TaxID=1872435 RepID=UPI0017FBEBB6|nr:glycosyltransferase family A protein [Algoriphagus sp.]NVJ86750.1 glycosyltransferase family 2 protein [Algoriphagus sp.]
MFSIIIPCHNKAPHISRSINSVINQTFQDWELIFVDDASTDSSIAEARKFNDTRIQIFHREIPGPGGYAARNFGVKKARSPWICFLDADDEWKLDYLENLKNHIENYRTIEFIGSAWEVSNGNQIQVCSASSQFASNEFHILKFSGFLEKSISNSPIVWTSTASVKRELFEKLEGFPEGICKSGGDIDTWFRLAKEANEVGFWNKISGTYHIDSVNMVTRTIRSFEIPCVVNTIHDLLKTSQPENVRLLKRYSNKYLLAQIAKSIKAKNYNPDLLRYFFAEVDKKKYAILKLFKFRIIRNLYQQYLEKKNPFYG